jgi:hypothetical protein
VANDGAMITLDNWHNVGYGAVRGDLCAGRKLRTKYALADLFAARTSRRSRRAFLPRWWRCVGGELAIAADNTLKVDDTLGWP